MDFEISVEMEVNLLLTGIWVEYYLQEPSANTALIQMEQKIDLTWMCLVLSLKYMNSIKLRSVRV